MKKLSVLLILCVIFSCAAVFAACGGKDNDSELDTEVTVSFDKNGGEGVAQSITVTMGEPYGTLPSGLIKAGYAFNGWWTGTNGTGTQVTSETIVTNKKNHTLYAKWSGKASTEGLSYGLINKDTEYEVRSIGTATDTDIIIPAIHNGKPVTSIGMFAFENCKSLTSIFIQDGIISIGDLAFRSCTSLVSVAISNSVTRISSMAFFECTSLKSIIIPSSVKSIGDNAFCGCTSLENITISNGLTSIDDWAFVGCSSLESVTIPKSVTSIGGGAFNYCESLINIKVDSNNIHYSSLDGVLFNKNQTTLVCYPSGKEEGEYSIPDSTLSIGNFAASGCSFLTSVIIGDTVASIGEGAFGDCSSLAGIFVSSNNDYYSSLDGVLFNKDKTVLVCYPAGKEGEAYSIPNGVISIDNEAFVFCNLLKSVIIPASVVNIGGMAFAFCESLIIRCEATSIPDGWEYNWNFSNCPVVLNYKPS